MIFRNQFHPTLILAVLWEFGFKIERVYPFIFIIIITTDCYDVLIIVRQK